jgi:hypothetical protein
MQIQIKNLLDRLKATPKLPRVGMVTFEEANLLIRQKALLLSQGWRPEAFDSLAMREAAEIP